MFHPWDWNKKGWSWNVQYHLFPWAVWHFSDLLMSHHSSQSLETNWEKKWIKRIKTFPLLRRSREQHKNSHRGRSCSSSHRLLDHLLSGPKASLFGLSLIPRNQENHSIISVYIYDPDTLFKKENTLCNYPDCHLSSPKIKFYCDLLLATKQWGKKPHQK